MILYGNFSYAVLDSLLYPPSTQDLEYFWAVKWGFWRSHYRGRSLPASAQKEKSSCQHTLRRNFKSIKTQRGLDHRDGKPARVA